jgi:protein disulfide-isomerase-like protein
MKIKRLIEKGLTSKMNLLQSMFSPKNLTRTVMILVALFVLYFIYKSYLKEGFESKASDFENDLTNDTKLVLFYADWCGHCKQFKPIWNETAKEVNKGNKKIMISVNVGDQDSDSGKLSEKYGVDGFPTVIIFSNGKKTNSYDGPRTKEGLMNVLG